MTKDAGTDLYRMAGLFGALAPVVLELQPDDAIGFIHGDPARLLGAGAEALLGKSFAGFVDARDRPIWRLVRHKLEKSSRVGPVPIRIARAGGTSGAAELHAVRVLGAPLGTVQMALGPYHGPLGLGESHRPPSSLARQFRQEDFTPLATRLSDYAAKVGASVADALVRLAGLDAVSADKRAEAHLWALYKLLHDAGSEGAAETDPEGEAPEAAQMPVKAGGAEVPAAPQAAVASAVKGAFKPRTGDVNYVTVAGEDGISEADAVKAAVYAMKKAAGNPRAMTMDGLTGGYEDRVNKVKAQLRAFKSIVVQERFDIALQPIVDIASGDCHHYEALARFDQQYYAGSPFEFMCFAEDIGVIHEFDLAMTMKVVSMIKRLRRLGYNIAVAVNLSGHSIQSQPFLRHFFRILEDCGDIRANLKFELTESSQIDDLQATNRVLSRIRDFGHKVCLDDFGAGAAGLQYLRVLKVDYVKIDGIYIRQGLEDAENRSFLRSMADLCAGLGIETVGECVENESQRQFLADIGVRYAQGWLYGKPAPVDEIVKTLGT